MMNVLLVVGLFLLAAGAKSLTLRSSGTSERDSWWNNDDENRIVYEVVNGEVVDDSYRQAIASESRRWPGGKIPYKISPELVKIRKVVDKAVAFWNDNTCVTLYEDADVSDDVRHLLLKRVDGCKTNVGYRGELADKEQVLSLTPGCHFPGRISHELGHAIGLWHMQSRPDFATFVKIYTKNMQAGFEHNFKKVSDITSFNLPFDYGSIMQYEADAFSANGRLTLVPEDPLAIALMGNSKGPDFQDYKLVNIMYKCNDKCAAGPKCSNGGYAAWNENKGCRCMCPEGWTGPNCRQAAPAEKPCLFNVTRAPFALKSPNFPETAGPDVGCAWMITPPAGLKVRVAFSSFEMIIHHPAGSKACPGDRLRVRSGDLMSDSPGQIYCGKDLANKALEVAGPILMEFRTNVQTNWQRKFDATITFV